jgi:hypothetical protein
MGGRVDTSIRVKQSVYHTRIQHIHGSMRLCTLALVARVGALIVVLFVALGVSAVVSDVMGRDLFATSRASTDLIQIVLHTGLVGWALHSSANPRPHLLVNVLIQRPLLPWLGIRGMWMLGNELAPQVIRSSVVMAYVTGA